MTRIVVLVLSLFILATLITVPTLAEESYKRYQIESGIVEYALSGTLTGTEIIYFDNWGTREAKYTTTELNFMGIKQKTNQLTILDDEWIFNIDLNTKTGTQLRNTILQEMAERSADRDLSEVGEEMMKNMGGEKIGTEDIAGKTCDVWEIKSLKTKTWIWKGITLKTVANLAGMETLSIATSVEENAEIPPARLAIPDEIELTKARDLEDLLKKTKARKK